MSSVHGLAESKSVWCPGYLTPSKKHICRTGQGHTRRMGTLRKKRKKEPSKSRGTRILLGSRQYHLQRLSQRIVFVAGSRGLYLVGYSSTQLIKYCTMCSMLVRETLRCSCQAV
mmetsp:Transcript_102587/g.185042  ORF Transcript_102587/g.185042 Transcript_102587/m.185042 type:complete len:114 (+) Transcript_102587:365-706(+)